MIYGTFIVGARTLMTHDDILLALTIAIPVLAVLFDHFFNVGISERHHSHHDTYLITDSLSHALVVAMVFMGFIGILLSWLCVMGVFTADKTVILAFFTAFLVVLFIIWLFMRRHRVATFENSMVITPLFGPSVTIHYRDITRMEWSGLRSGTGYQNLSIYIPNKPPVSIWGVLDIEQILLRINRFDVLAH